MKNGQTNFFSKKNVITLGILVWSAVFVSQALAIPIFINELHYDNAGGDTGEAIEIAGLAGTDLAEWKLVLYTGSNSKSYKTVGLSGTIPDQESGFGTLFFSITGIQNGGREPDAMALIDPGNNVIQFLSYEGSFTAANGFANGLTSTDIVVSESSSTDIGYSLQLTGNGYEYSDFSWENAGPSTFGGINTGQTFGQVPEPSILLLIGSGLLGLRLTKRSRSKKD